MVDTYGRVWYGDEVNDDTIKEEVNNMAKFGFEFSFRDEDGNYVSGQGSVKGSDEDEAFESVLELVRDGLSLEREQQEYDVKVTVEFRYTDEDGEYEDATEVQSAVERGDFDWTNEDYSVYEVEVNEA